MVFIIENAISNNLPYVLIPLNDTGRSIYTDQFALLRCSFKMFLVDTVFWGIGKLLGLVCRTEVVMSTSIPLALLAFLWIRFGPTHHLFPDDTSRDKIKPAAINKAVAVDYTAPVNKPVNFKEEKAAPEQIDGPARKVVVVETDFGPLHVTRVIRPGSTAHILTYHDVGWFGFSLVLLFIPKQVSITVIHSMDSSKHWRGIQFLISSPLSTSMPHTNMHMLMQFYRHRFYCRSWKIIKITLSIL
jgi:hypothetical protein